MYVSGEEGGGIANVRESRGTGLNGHGNKQYRNFHGGEVIMHNGFVEIFIVNCLLKLRSGRRLRNTIFIFNARKMGSKS